MEFIGSREEESDDFSPNISTLLLNSVDSSVVDGFNGDQIERYLEKQFYTRSVVVQNGRVARKHVAF